MTNGKLLIMFSSHNGAGTLPAMLEAYAELTPPSCEWRMICIDNASTDNTYAIMAQFADRLPITVLSEPRPGKNRALNRGLSHANLDFDLVVLTDDDAPPEKNFLIKWEDILNSYPEYQVFGGVVEPSFRDAPSKWLRKFATHYFILYAENLQTSGPTEPGAIFGPNMAVRRSVFADGHRFNEDIGPNCGDANYAMGSETEFCQRVHAAGARTYFFSGPMVRHIVRPGQMTRSFVRGRAFRFGRGVGVQDRFAGIMAGDTGLLYYLRQALRFLKAAAGNHEAWWDAHQARGYHSAHAPAGPSGRSGTS